MYKISNIYQMNLHAQGNFHNNATNNSLEKLGSGLKINKASDDGSGLAIADNLKSQANTIKQSIKNANDTIGIIQIADKAMDEQGKILDTIKQKMVQSAQDGQTKDTRLAIKREVTALMKSFDNIAKTTSYNGMTLLDGTFTNKSFEVGSSSNQVVNLDILSTTVDKIGQTSFKKSTTTIAKDPDNPFGDVNMKIKSHYTGKFIDIPKTKIGYQRDEGVGALAREINLSSSRTGVKAFYDVSYQFSNPDTPIKAGTTPNDFTINGVVIGGLDVQDNDSSGILVSEINKVTHLTSVKAWINEIGALRLKSDDGRAIDIKPTDRNTSLLNMSIFLQPDIEIKEDFALNGASGEPRFNFAWGLDGSGHENTDLDPYVKSPNNEGLGYGKGNTTNDGGVWDLDDTGNPIPNNPNEENMTWINGGSNGNYNAVIASCCQNNNYATNVPVTITIEHIKGLEYIEIQGYLNAGDTEAPPIVYNKDTGNVTLPSTAPYDNFTMRRYINSNSEFFIPPIIGELKLISQHNSTKIEVEGTGLEYIGMERGEGLNYQKNLFDVDEINKSLLDSSDGIPKEPIQESIDILDSTIYLLDMIRADLGSVQNQLTSMINNLSITEVNVRSSESTIRDVDFASESANFKKIQLLQQGNGYAMSQISKLSTDIISKMLEV